jgi:hypothetical protein
MRHIKAMMYLSAVGTGQASYIARRVGHDLPLRDAQMMNDRRVPAFG